MNNYDHQIRAWRSASAAVLQGRVPVKESIFTDAGYICIYIYIYIYTYTHIHTYICLCMYVCMYIYIYREREREKCIDRYIDR